MSCTEIRFFDLDPAAVQRLRGKEPVLDLPEAFSIRLSKDVERLTELNKIVTEGALGFFVPATDRNDAIFIEYQTPLTLDNQRIEYRISVQVSGHTLAFNRLIVKQKDDKRGGWEIELRRSADHWIELASQLKANQIDYGISSTHYLSIENSWSAPEYQGTFNPADNDCTHWPIIDFGGWQDLTEPPQGTENRVKFIDPADVRPLISFAYLLKQGFCQIGWTIQGVLFDTPYFRRLWLYILRENYYEADTDGGRIRGRNFVRTLFIQNTTYQMLRFRELIKGVFSLRLPNDYPGFIDAWSCGIYNTAEIALRYKFIIKGEFTNDRSLPFTAVWQVFEVDPNDNNDFTGEILSDPADAVVIEFDHNETKYINVEIEATLKARQKAAIGVGVKPSSDFWVEKGLYFEVVPVSKCVMPGNGIVTVADMVSDKTSLLDWLKAAVHLVNGRIETDFDLKVLTVHPKRKADFWGAVVPSFLLEENPSVEISDQVVEESVKITNLRPQQKRFTRIQFADTSDAYIESLSLSEPAHSRKIQNGENLPNEIEDIQNPVIEPTLEGRPSYVASSAGGRNPLPMLPRMWDNTEGEPSYNIGPRILFSFGLVRQKNPNQKTNTKFPHCDFYWSNPVNIAADQPSIEYFGYATQLRTFELDPTPAIDANVVFYSFGVDLFVLCYLGLLKEKRGGSTVDLIMKMNLKQYNEYNFRSLFAFRYKGRPIRAEMTSIRDFAACLEIPTPATFLIPAQDTSCCDLPCGCVFSVCEYYFDFGVYLLQETLDEMRLSSFVVDGKELVSTPLSFGELEIVDVESDPYVLNLVTLLQSVGAPYFDFANSTRVHPTKGRRYFKLTRPSCTPFSITITHNGSPVYHYTDEVQEQQWFGGGWSALGYGGVTHSTPIDCQTITQY